MSAPHPGHKAAEAVPCLGPRWNPPGAGSPGRSAGAEGDGSALGPGRPRVCRRGIALGAGRGHLNSPGTAGGAGAPGSGGPGSRVGRSPPTAPSPAARPRALARWCARPRSSTGASVRSHLRVVVAERLRRRARNPLGSPRAGSSPADYGVFSCDPLRLPRQDCRGTPVTECPAQSLTCNFAVSCGGFLNNYLNTRN